VLVNKPMPAFDAATNETGYGATAPIRWASANEAGKLGAVGVLVRSVTAKAFRMPHTGSMAAYTKDGPKVPAAALAPEDADFVARAAQKGPVTIELEMGAKTLPDAESGNAIAELTGRELPDEVVVVGGHIDSWDVGDGANDDGSGCAMAMDAALLLKELGLVPKRTVRVVMFTNEENGLRGGKGYFEAHGKEKHAGAIEADFGAGAPRGFDMKVPAELAAQLRAWMPLFSGLGVTQLKEGHTGADISPLEEAGVPCVGLEPDGSRYFDVHHSNADTIDKIDAGYLQKNAGALALMVYLLAER
jgi:carboxypeptidase Q